MQNQPNNKQSYYIRHTEPYYLSRYGVKEDEVKEMTHIKHIKHIYPEILTSSSRNERSDTRKRHNTRTHSVKSNSIQNEKYADESFVTESSLRSTSTAHRRSHRSHSERSHRSDNLENSSTKRKYSPQTNNQRPNNKSPNQRRTRNSEYSSEIRSINHKRKISPTQNKNFNIESECFQTDGSRISNQSEKGKREINGSHVVFDDKSLNSISSLRNENSESISLLSQSSESQSIRSNSSSLNKSNRHTKKNSSRESPIRNKTLQIIKNEDSSSSQHIKKENDGDKKLKNRVEFIIDKDIFFQNETNGSSENDQQKSKFIIKRKNQRFLKQKRYQKKDAEIQCHRLLIDQENIVEYHSLLIDQESEPKYLHLLIDQENKVEYHSSFFEQYHIPIVDQNSKVEYSYNQTRTNSESKEELIKNEQEITNASDDLENRTNPKEEQKMTNDKD